MRPQDGERAAGSGTTAVRAVLFDRDGTLVHDVPYNTDPDLVAAVDGAREVLDDLRRRGIGVGVVSNQSGIARGLITPTQLDAVNGRVEEILGPIDTWQVCPHGAADGCACRKPAPGLVLAAAAALGVDPSACVVIGDIGADVGAALAAGARAVLVPTSVTRAEEVAHAREHAAVAQDLRTAVALALSPEGGRPPTPPDGPHSLALAEPPVVPG
ncbi:MAG: HAD-IIIA family hydrolase [Janthinobacterium lividum]